MVCSVFSLVSVSILFSVCRNTLFVLIKAHTVKKGKDNSTSEISNPSIKEKGFSVIGVIWSTANMPSAASAREVMPIHITAG